MLMAADAVVLTASGAVMCIANDAVRATAADAVMLTNADAMQDMRRKCDTEDRNMRRSKKQTRKGCVM